MTGKNIIQAVRSEDAQTVHSDEMVNTQIPLLQAILLELRLMNMRHEEAYDSTLTLDDVEPETR